MENKTCSLCGKPMKVRMGAKGQFWGCSGYPDCKHTEPLGEREGFTKPEPNKVDVATEMLITLQSIDMTSKVMLEVMQKDNFQGQL